MLSVSLLLILVLVAQVLLSPVHCVHSPIHKVDLSLGLTLILFDPLVSLFLAPSPHISYESLLTLLYSFFLLRYIIVTWKWCIGITCILSRKWQFFAAKW